MSGVANVGVTVGMPVYNGDRFLRAALESILAQTHEDFALFISDNGSTDDTQEICRHFASRDERISYERHEQNLGAAWNYNRVFLVSGGAYFKWAAADDLLAPTCLERCVETLSNAPDSVVMVYPKTRIVDASGMVVGDWDDELDVRSTRPSWRFNRVVRNFVLGNPVFGLARRDALERTQLHGGYPSSDYVLLAELALRGEIWEIPEPLFLRRLHDATSRAANESVEEISTWFDPAAEPETDEKRRVRRELVRAVLRSDIGFREQVTTLAIFPSVWSRRHSNVYASFAAAWGRARRVLNVGERGRGKPR